MAPRVGRYFDILIYHNISNCDYRIEAKNLSDDLSKLSSCSITIVILLRNMYIACRILNKLKVSLHSSNKYTLKKCISKTSIIVNAFRSNCTARSKFSFPSTKHGIKLNSTSDITTVMNSKY